jgi:hypothetical protein
MPGLSFQVVGGLADSHKSAPDRRSRSERNGHVHERVRAGIDLDPDAVGKLLDGIHGASPEVAGAGIWGRAGIRPGTYIVVDRGCHC